MSEDEPNKNEFEDSEEPEIWDEMQWEEFFKESDARADRHGKLLEKYEGHPEAEKLIAKEMGWDWLVEALEAKERGEIPEEDDDEMWLDDEEEEGEEWKRAAGFEPEVPDHEFERDYPPVYFTARQLSYDAIDFIEGIEDKYPHQECIQKFIEGATVPAAKIAGASAFGLSLESLGGNIANCKRGLAAANKCLEGLQEMKAAGIISENVYGKFFPQAKAMRDELALHIADLRDRFQKGIP